LSRNPVGKREKEWKIECCGVAVEGKRCMRLEERGWRESRCCGAAVKKRAGVRRERGKRGE
jgi:hypothetical protein